MNHTIANIKQMFNVKDIAYATTLDNLAEGQFGIFADGSDTSVASGVTLATLPAKFRIFSKLNGKMYYSFDTIEKAKLQNSLAKAYVAPTAMSLTTVIEYNKQMKSVVLKVNIDEQSLIQRDGLTWTHSDFVVEVASADLAEYQLDANTVYGVYENNVVTKLMVEKILAMNSPYFTAAAGVATADITATANVAAVNAIGAPTVGDVASAADTGKVYQYNGATWDEVGVLNATIGGANITNLATFVENSKALNTNDTIGDEGAKLIFVLNGVPKPAGTYKDLEVNYVSPRGVKLSAGIEINGEKNLGFTVAQALVYEIGAGYDLRAEEFDCMSLYTNLNFNPQLSDKLASPDLVYQFENAKNYNVISFEFTTDKVERNTGEKRLFGVLLGVEDNTAFGELKTAFGL